MRTSFAHAADRIAFGILVAVLFLAPFPVASNRDGLIGVSASLLALAVFLSALARSVPAPAASHSAALPLALPRSATLWLGLLGLVVAWVWVAPLVVQYPALDVHRAKVYQVKALAYFCVAALVLLTVRQTKRLWVLLGAVVVSGTLEALLAIFSLQAGVEFTLFGVPFFVLNRATGTFPNPDHFANYMAMSMALGLGLMLATGQNAERQRPGWRGKALAALRFLMSGRMLVRLAIVIMVIGLVLSRSRMGNASFFIGLFALIGTVAWGWPEKRKGALWLGASLLVIDLVVIGQWVGLEHVVQRLKDTELSAEAPTGAHAGATGQQEETLEDRLSIGRDAAKLVERSPWVGHGPGSFWAVFPQVKSPSLLLWFDHAHNDYVELAADLGLPALIGLGGVVAMTLMKWAQLMRQSVQTPVKGAACGAGMAVLCMLMHAVVDFNLHIHANAMLFVMALALPFALPSLSSTRKRHAPRRVIPTH